MTDPEGEYQRLVSGDAGVIAAATEALHSALLDVDRAQEDLAGCGVRDWSGLGADAYASRLEVLRTGVARAHVALGVTHSAVATAEDAYTWCDDTATYFIRHWRSRPAGLPPVVEELFARLVNGLLLATGTTYNARLAGVTAVLTGDDEDLDELSDEARAWVEQGLARNQEWLDDYGSTLGPRIPSIGAWGDGRGRIPQGLGYDPRTGLLLQGFYDQDDGDPSVMALIDEVTGEKVGEVKLGGVTPGALGQEDVDHGTPGHAGGVTVDGDTVYVTDKGKVYTYSLSDMRDSGPGATVQPQSVQTVDNGGSYSAMKDGLLYLGTFTEKSEGTLHVYQPDGRGGWVEMPDRAVTTPPRCQGVIVRNGEYVFSTSFGRDNESALVVQDHDGSRESYAFPNMSEGLVEVDGNVLVTYESGATKYGGDEDDLWPTPNLTSTPLSGLGLSGEFFIGPESLVLVAAELEGPGRRMTRTSHDVAAVRLSAGDLGKVPQAPDFAQAVRRLVASIGDGLRASGTAVGHAADSLRATARDAARTDDAVHSGFDRARLD
ncbi:hypothetical protein SAMN05192575_105267 [Nocardioides alpinus]|uniref:Uncharacterized protein n=1 Tax=Nocardioides alpinus TaxID=748909 RepID=A0A1I0ZHH9_9ACTN|nr:hypothetical protein [Nocardioides alpinus]PKH40649.1 hypothetical protein CXG46_11690 [Nocardioides alpinus]SFB23858.1 hypothetical protein SAMN05192575_105267 [Nocardioides alpinus]